MHLTNSSHVRTGHFFHLWILWFILCSQLLYDKSKGRLIKVKALERGQRANKVQVCLWTFRWKSLKRWRRKIDSVSALKKRSGKSKVLDCFKYTLVCGYVTTLLYLKRVGVLAQVWAALLLIQPLWTCLIKNKRWPNSGASAIHVGKWMELLILEFGQIQIWLLALSTLPFK